MLISDKRVHFFSNLGIKVQLTVKVEIMHALPPTLSFLVTNVRSSWSQNLQQIKKNMTVF